MAKERGITLNTVIQGMWALLLARHGGEPEAVFGATRACRRTSVEGAEKIVGTFINTLPLRLAIDTSMSVFAFLEEVRRQHTELRDFEQTPLVDVMRYGSVPAGTPLFESIVMFDYETIGASLAKLGGPWERRRFELVEQTSYPLTLYVYAEAEMLLKLAYDTPRFDAAGMEKLLGRLVVMLEALAENVDRSLGAVPMLSGPERERLLVEWNATQRPYDRTACIHGLIAQQVERTPEAPAVAAKDRVITYRELDRRSNQLARHLQRLGVGPDGLVALSVERGIDMLVAILGIHKAGGAYVPLDPTYPQHRIQLMLEDSKAPVLITQAHLEAELGAKDTQVVAIDRDWAEIGQAPDGPVESAVQPEHLAYMIYTSGSTGRPKGVMVEHRNVVNFFAAMDDRLGTGPGDPGERGVWLAVTSLSFDISVLELLWPLTRGFEVVVQGEEHLVAASGASSLTKKMDFSLFYFASDEGSEDDKYRLLMEGARFADANGFSAVWTPERHFHAFGGLYPNPAVTGAAVAAITKNVRIRAGSVVLPLHSPIRVAEEWSVVDNLSRGRVEISIASGWHPEDFALLPANYERRKAYMYEAAETIKALWRGETCTFPGPVGEVKVRTLPRPVQKELPILVTAAGSPDTFRSAGTMGASILTHFLGQSAEDVAKNIAVYREAWRAAGHAGEGKVCLMLHTYIGEDIDQVRELVREPMKRYLKSSLSLVRNFAGAWTAFKRGEAKAQLSGDEFMKLTPEETESLLDFAFERYFETSALFGTVESCMAMVEQLAELGVDEIACLIDFGVETEKALEGLHRLNELRQAASGPREVAPDDFSLPAQVRRHGVTHFQCTPSMAAMLLMAEENKAALRGLKACLIGGEAFPVELARQLQALVGGQVINMYGPTETTIWSSCHVLGEEKETIPIGRPLANTELFILDPAMQPVPPGVAAELFIGGDGVVRGYFERPELTGERFVAHPFDKASGRRVYRTGDLARFREDGTVEFLGRTDHQVKIRGYRIELGEIESALRKQPGVRDAVVIARRDAPGDQVLVGYVLAEGEPRLSSLELRNALRGELPEFMVPSHVVQLEAFPLTPNKKVDRKALPAPEEVREERPREIAEPQNDVEQRISAIWREVLNLPNVGIDENFFDLGGHSLLAVQVHSKLKKVSSRPVSITDLFRFPTIAALAAHLADNPADGGDGEAEGAAPASAPVSRGDRIDRRRAIREQLRRGR